MTRKDYQTIASAIAATRASYAPNWNPNLFRACDDVAKRMADALEKDNPRFNREVFLDACGVKTEF